MTIKEFFRKYRFTIISAVIFSMVVIITLIILAGGIR
jgi:uncharacterized membrane protein